MRSCHFFQLISVRGHQVLLLGFHHILRLPSLALISEQTTFIGSGLRKVSGSKRRHYFEGDVRMLQLQAHDKLGLFF